MRVPLILAMIVLMVAPTNIASGLSQISSGANQDLLRLPIDNLDLEADNINLLLSSFSARTKIPIGLEVSPDDDLSVTKRIRLQIKHGTLADALNSIVMDNPLYAWKIEDEVVNIFPRDANRDSLLREVLETKLEKFSITRGMGRFALRQTLSTSPAVKTVLAQHNVLPDNQTFMSRDFQPLGRNYAFEAANLSVSTLLNQVIRDSETKYWIVMRYGERKQYFVLNL